MPRSIYRSDISQEDIKKIVNFSYGINKLISDPFGRWGTVLDLGPTAMIVPIWCKTGMGWQLSCHHKYVKEAIGIDRHTMSRLAKYLNIKSRDLVQLLYKLGMLSVDPADHTTVLQDFTGIILGADLSTTGNGYIVEKRRALDGFTQSDERKSQRLSDKGNPEAVNGN